MIDSSISLGSLISAVGVIVTLAGLFWRMMHVMATKNDVTMQTLNQYHRENATRLAAVEVKVDVMYEYFISRMERRDRRDD